MTRGKFDTMSGVAGYREEYRQSPCLSIIQLTVTNYISLADYA